MMTGMFLVTVSERRFSSTAKPSILGSRMSRKTMSGTWFLAWSRPSSPDLATVTRYPSSSSLSLYISATAGSSSMKRTLTSSSTTSLMSPPKAPYRESQHRVCHLSPLSTGGKYNQVHPIFRNLLTGKPPPSAKTQVVPWPQRLAEPCGAGARGAFFPDGIFARSHPWRDRGCHPGPALCARIRAPYAAAGVASARSGGGHDGRRQRSGGAGYAPSAGRYRNRKQGQAPIGGGRWIRPWRKRSTG